MTARRQRSKKNWLDRMESKYGKYAIKDLSRYIIGLYVIGFIVSLFDSMNQTSFYFDFLSLDIGAILKGQIWRIFTFLLYPPTPYGSATDILWFVLMVYVYLMIGRSLENAWGSFRFNVYCISNVLFVVLGQIISEVLFGISGFGSETYYINLTMFLAFATLYPNMEFLLFFLIPVKVKWLAILDIVMICFGIFTNFMTGIRLLAAGYNDEAYVYFIMIITSIMCILNFLIFFFTMRKNKRKSAARVKSFQRKMQQAVSNRSSRHECEVCKKTEEDNPDLEFRYCSKCDGNHEYCMEHLFTHEHIKRFSINIDKDDL